MINPKGGIRASTALKHFDTQVTCGFERSLNALTRQQILSARQAALYRLEQNLNKSFTREFTPIPSRQEENGFIRIGRARTHSPIKEVLNAETVFQKGYLPEIKNANRLLTRIATMNSKGMLFTDAAAMQKLEETINKTIVNDSLRQYLLEDLANQDYPALIKDLADYYTLSRNYAARLEIGYLSAQNAADAFAFAASSYLERHPHKINLKWRRLMRHPAVSKQLQESLQTFINKNSISNADLEMLQPLLKEAYLQHATALSALKSAPELQASAQVYQEYLDRLKDFVAKNNRLPLWNMVDEEERALAQELEVLILHDDHILEPFNSLTTQIKEIINQYKIVPTPFEEVLPKIQDFYQKHHRLPQIYSNNPQTAAEEIDLYEQYVYWELNGTTAQRKALFNISQLADK